MDTMVEESYGFSRNVKMRKGLAMKMELMIPQLSNTIVLQRFKQTIPFVSL